MRSWPGVVWHVNSTAHGGGVAEMLQSLLAYARGAGVDARWLTIAGHEEFFRVTKSTTSSMEPRAMASGWRRQTARSTSQPCWKAPRS